MSSLIFSASHHLKHLLGIIVCIIVCLVTGCGGGGGGSTSDSVITGQLTMTSNSGTITLVINQSTNLRLTFPSGSAPIGTVITAQYTPASSLPVAIDHSIIKRNFTTNAGNIYVAAFSISTAITNFSKPVTLDGTNVTGLPEGTLLSVAYLDNGAWVDIGALTVTAAGGFVTLSPTTSLPGILHPGNYVIYRQPTSTDNGNHAATGLQIFYPQDSSNIPLATPSVKTLYTNLMNINGQSLTSDGKYGLLVSDNIVRFFTNANTGSPVASAASLDISPYSLSGSSVVIFPAGNEAVVTGGGDSLVVISGINSGNPVLADTISVPSPREGLALSSDGKVLLARGADGLTVFSVTSIPTKTGTLGGPVSHSFSEVLDIPDAGSGYYFSGGRDGMAFSPKDSSKAVIIGDPSGNPSIRLLSGLPGNPSLSSLQLSLPNIKPHKYRVMTRGLKPNLVLTGPSYVSSVAVTPDGTKAIVGTDAGLVLVSGISSGTLSQVNTPFSPTFTVSGTPYTLAGINSLAITKDGKYAVAMTPQPSPDLGSILTVPITSNGFANPVGQLSNAYIPNNDIMLIQ